MRESLDSLKRSILRLGCRIRTRFARRPLRTTIQTFAVLLLLLVVVWAGLVAYSGMMVKTKSDELTALMDDPDEIELSTVQIESLESDIHSINANVKRLDHLTAVPLFEPVLNQVPFFGPRYEAARTTLKLGSALGDAGAIGAAIGSDAYRALDQTGISWDPDETEDTWLMAIDHHREEIPAIGQNIQHASELRAEIDEDMLPGFVASSMETLDSALDHSDELHDLVENYDQFFRAAGGEGTIRYLFLFQNPAELRPAGGFPGTFGVFEFRSGQLVDYEMWDSHEVTRDYIDNRTHKRDQPWAFKTYAPQDGWLLHDGTWYSDFPYTAQQTLEMYDETTWPEVNGVVAVQPEAVSDMVHVTGPVEVDIDGELREINEENVYDEVERYRWLRFQGEREGELGDHKEILIDIGEAIMDEFRSSGGNDMTEAVKLLTDSAERRDLQIYIDEPAVQRFLDRRGWSGKLVPDLDTPTLALTFTNFVLEKASMAMDPHYDLNLVEQDDGSYRAVMHMRLEHTGKHDQDPRYFGFQRWWIEARLPEGSEWLSSNYERMPDPEAHNGGSYTVDLFPEQTREIRISFALPDIDTLMIRRQPGQVPPPVTVHHEGCDPVDAGYLVRDLYIDLGSGCPEVDEDEIENEPPELLQLS